MANSDKDILITPNKSQSALPEISFVGSGNAPITLKVLDIFFDEILLMYFKRK